MPDQPMQPPEPMTKSNDSDTLVTSTTGAMSTSESASPTFTDEELSEWRTLAVGKRLIIGGESLALKDARTNIDFRRRQIEGFFPTPLTQSELEHSHEELRKAQAWEARELLQAPSDQDFHRETIPYPAKWRNAWAEDQRWPLSRSPMVWITTSAEGIITHVDRHFVETDQGWSELVEESFKAGEQKS